MSAEMSQPSSRLLISMVGKGPNTGGYAIAQYRNVDGEAVRTSKWCAEAFASHYKIGPKDRILLLTTEESRSNLEQLLPALEPFQARVDSLMLPRAMSDWREWGVKLLRSVEGETRAPIQVLFDMTLGFRSDSALVLLVLLYLSRFSAVKMMDVCYARTIGGSAQAVASDRSAPAAQTGFYQLESLEELQQTFALADAATILQWTGDTTELVKLLRETEKRKRVEKRGRLEGEPLYRKQLIEALEKLSTELMVVSLPGIQDQLTAIQRDIHQKDRLGGMEAEFRMLPLVNALEDLLDGCEEMHGSDKGPFIPLARNLIRWFEARSNLPSAVMVATESTTSRLMIELKLGTEWCDRDHRQPVAKFLTALATNRGAKTTGVVKSFLATLSGIVEYRNSFAHCFINEGPSAESALKNSRRWARDIHECLGNEALWRELAQAYRAQAGSGPFDA